MNWIRRTPPFFKGRLGEILPSSIIQSLLLPVIPARVLFHQAARWV
jgi:hypothetical protein